MNLKIFSNTIAAVMHEYELPLPGVYKENETPASGAFCSEKTFGRWVDGKSQTTRTKKNDMGEFLDQCKDSWIKASGEAKGENDFLNSFRSHLDEKVRNEYENCADYNVFREAVINNLYASFQQLLRIKKYLSDLLDAKNFEQPDSAPLQYRSTLVLSYICNHETDLTDCFSQNFLASIEANGKQDQENLETYLTGQDEKKAALRQLRIDEVSRIALQYHQESGKNCGIAKCVLYAALTDPKSRFINALNRKDPTIIEGTLSQLTGQPDKRYIIL